jgi:hypothetical protein
LANIIPVIDEFIVDRLKLIAIDGVTLPVRPYEPSRERDKNEYPFASVTRVGIEEDKVRRRFGIEVITPKTTKKTIQLANGNVRVVPTGYDVRDYPGVYILRYIIDTEAVLKEHADTLLYMMDQAFPFGYEPSISGQYMLFDFTKPINNDELHKPLFKMSYLFDVYGVAIEKLEYYEVVPMSELLFDTEPENVPTEDGLWERPAE